METEQNGRPKGKVLPKGVQNVPHNPISPPDEEGKQRDEDTHPEKTQLLADDRVNKIGVSIRKEEYLLSTFSESTSQPASSAKNNEGLNDLESAVLGILPRVQKSEHSPYAIGMGRNQQAADQTQSNQTSKEIQKTPTSNIEHQQDGENDQHNNTEIRLQQNEKKINARDNEVEHKSPKEEGQHRLLTLKIGCDIDDEDNLEQFGRLNAKISEPNPTAPSLDLGSDSGDEHQNQKNEHPQHQPR